MGDVVQLSEARRSHRPLHRATEPAGPATIALFTGVRIERWCERDPEPVDAPRTRPTTPRRRRRRD
jgi:hypothetical protein